MGLIWTLEWQLARARPRLFAMNVGVPLLLVTPMVAGGAPEVHAVAALTVLFVLFGTFGSAIPALRDGERGLVARLARTGLRPWEHILGRALVGAALDTLQLTPSLLVLGAAHGTLPEALWMGVPVLAASLTMANLVGLWVAAVARSIAEGALLAAVTGLLLVHASGAFRTPVPGSVGAAIEGWSPYRTLHETLLALAGAGDAAAAPVNTLVVLVLLLAATAVTATQLVNSLASARTR